METSGAEAHGWRCLRCGDDTTQDQAGRGFVRHRSNAGCGYGHGERDDPPGAR